MAVKISELPAGTPPYAADTLVEVSVLTGSPPSYASEKAQVGDLVMLPSASNATLPDALDSLGLGTASNVTFNSLTAGGALGYPTSAPRLHGFGNVFGTTSGGGVQSHYVLNTDSDTANCTSAGGCYNLYSGMSYGGATLTGNRTGAFFFMDLTATSGNTGTGTWYTALGSESRASANDNGAAGDGNQRGDVFGFNTTARLASGATFFNSVVGVEIDVSADAGSSVAYKTGLGIVQLATDVNQGVTHDVAFHFVNQHSGTAPGWLDGIQFGGPTGWWPLASTATIIGTAAGFAGGPAYAADYGMDFSAVTFSSGFLKSTGFLVDGAGATSAASLNIGAGALGTGVLFHEKGSTSNLAIARIQENSGNTATDGGAHLDLYGTRSDGSSGVYASLRGLRLNNASNDNGYFAIWTSSTGGTALTEKVRISEDGSTQINGSMTLTGALVTPTSTPASASAAGVAGTIAWDANFIYICTATNTWKRVAIATW